MKYTVTLVQYQRPTSDYLWRRFQQATLSTARSR